LLGWNRSVQVIYGDLDYKLELVVKPVPVPMQFIVGMMGIPLITGFGSQVKGMRT